VEACRDSCAIRKVRFVESPKAWGKTDKSPPYFRGSCLPAGCLDFAICRVIWILLKNHPPGEKLGGALLAAPGGVRGGAIRRRAGVEIRPLWRYARDALPRDPALNFSPCRQQQRTR